MANERDLELLDDYLTNRLSEQDRSAFEQKLKADPDLHHEYALQKRLIQGIKDARVAQLKSILNQVPVPSASTGNAIATKVILGTLMTLMIAAAAFWYYHDEPVNVEQATAPPSQQQQQQQDIAPVQEPEQSEAKPEAKTSQRSVVREKQVQEIDKNQTSAGTEHSRPSLAKRPDPVSAPSSPIGNSDVKDEEATVSVIENDGYSFHYKVENGNLILFGPFKQGAYEIVTVSENGKSIRSLYYQDKYYLLDDSNNEIRSLSPVADPSLLQKLQEKTRE